MSREQVLTVTIKDCEVQTFRSGGPGGQNQNKVNSGVRIIHHPSGARAECRETRDQLTNKRRAWQRLASDPRFKAWVAIQCGHVKSAEQIRREVDAELADPSKVRVEVRDHGQWVVESQEDQ